MIGEQAHERCDRSQLFPNSQLGSDETCWSKLAGAPVAVVSMAAASRLVKEFGVPRAYLATGYDSIRKW